jgi:hypothetical protein
MTMRNSNITSRSNVVFGIRQDRAVVAGADRVHASATLARSFFGHLHLLAERTAMTLTRYWQMAAMATTKRTKCAVVVAVTPPVGRSVRAVPRVSAVRT